MQSSTCCLYPAGATQCYHHGLCCEHLDGLWSLGSAYSIRCARRAAVDAEQAANRAIGEATGCWKAGVLVEDDAGSVAAALAARDAGGAEAGAADVAPA